MKTKEVDDTFNSLPKEYEKYTISQILDSDKECLKEIKQWCCNLMGTQFENAINFLKDEN